MSHAITAGRAAAAGPEMQKAPRTVFWGLSTDEVRRCPTLPQGHPCSTIGAESLSFRVRNVTGRFPLAMAAETLLMFQKPTHPLVEPPRSGVSKPRMGRQFPYIGNHKVDASNSRAIHTHS